MLKPPPASPAKPQAQRRGRVPRSHSRRPVPDTPDCDPGFRECEGSGQ